MALRERRPWNLQEFQRELFRIGGSNLVAYWPLDDQSGTTARDIGPNAEELDITGTTLGQNGPPQLGRSHSFDGINDVDSQHVYEDETGASWGPTVHGLSLADGVAFARVEGVDLSPFAGTEGSDTPYMLVLTDDAGSKVAWGYCFPKGTAVWTDRGLRQIGGIKKDDLVLTHTGRYRPVTNWHRRKYDDDLVVLNTYLSKEIKVTPEHPFLASKDGLTAEWIDAGDIRKGDWLVFVPPKGSESLTSVDMRKYKEGVETNLPDEIEITDEFLRFLGLYISEGCVTTHNRVSVGMGDFDALYPLVRWAYSLGLRFSFRGPYSSSNQYTLTIPDLGLSNFLDSEFGFGAGTKQLPQWVYDLSEEDRVTLFLWMNVGDGCTQPYNVKYYTVSRRLADDMVLLLASIGIASDVKIRPPRYCFIDGRTGKSNTQYEVSFSPPEWMRPMLGLPSLKRKPQNAFGMRQEDGRLFVKVQGVDKEHYEGFVYNLSVADDNSYAVDLATVHNCGAQEAAEGLGAEKLNNIGFETAGGGGADVFANWVESAGAGSIVDEGVLVHGGSHALKIASDAGTAEVFQTSAGFSAGALYKLTFWTRGDGTYAGRYKVRDVTAGTDFIGPITTGVTGTSYTQAVAYFTVPAGCSSIAIAFFSPATVGGTAYFDDISLKEVLHPGTDAVHIVSTRDGSTRNWAGIDGSFDYNGSAYTFEVRKTLFQITGAMAVGMWLKHADADLLSVDVIASKGSVANANFAWALSLGAGNDNALWETQTAGRVLSLGTKDVCDQSWHFIVGVYDGSKQYLYVDGVLEGSDIQTGALVDSYAAAWVGAGWYYGGATVRYLNGNLSHAWIMDKALDARVVKRLYDIGRRAHSG